MAKVEMKNVKALKAFRLKDKSEDGKTRTVAVGEVVSKNDFKSANEWKNLCAMEPKPRAEETDDAVGKPKATKGAKAPAGLPGAK